MNASHNRTRALAAGAVVAASFAVTACGSTTSPTIINGEAIERAIEHSSLTQRGQHVQVSCPSGVHQKKGLVFTCTALGQRGPLSKRATTRFIVTQLDNAGHVHYVAR